MGIATKDVWIGHNDVLMPVDSKVLHFGEEYGLLRLWILIGNSGLFETWKLNVCMTGSYPKGVYLGCTKCNGQMYFLFREN